MNVYVSHPSSISFREEVYEPIRQSELDDKHAITLPHEASDRQFDSKNHFRQNCDLVVAVVSAPSTGVGIELGWADMFDVPIACIHEESVEPSGSIRAVADRVDSYEDGELVHLLEHIFASY